MTTQFATATAFSDENLIKALHMVSVKRTFRFVG
jgi:hypothetical protein